MDPLSPNLPNPQYFIDWGATRVEQFGRCPGCNKSPKRWGAIIAYVRGKDRKRFFYYICRPCLTHFESLPEGLDGRGKWLGDNVEPRIDASITLTERAR